MRSAQRVLGVTVSIAKQNFSKKMNPPRISWRHWRDATSLKSRSDLRSPMHKATVLYDINGTTAEANVEGTWITSQTFPTGQAILYIKEAEEGTIQGTFEVNKFYVIRIDRR
jgi:hypothetical protein